MSVTAEIDGALVLGTRGSLLARIQTDEVKQLLERASPGQKMVVQTISTRGDRDKVAPLSVIGGQGIFVKELEQALLDGRIDVAVHSLKDLPPILAPGLVIAAVPVRSDPRDVLISRDGQNLAALASGSRIGTSSARRRAQLMRARGDCQVVEIRGNVPTRIDQVRAGRVDAVVLAAAGLMRLGLISEVAECFPIDRMLPSPGQGALAIEAREDNRRLLDLLAQVNDFASQASASAERAFLARLGAGCSLPVAAFAETHDGTFELSGMILAGDGSNCIEQRVSGAVADAVALGSRLASDLLEAGGDLLGARF